MYLCINIPVYVCTYIPVYVCTYISIYPCIDVSMYLCVYVSMCLFEYVKINIKLHIHHSCCSSHHLFILFQSADELLRHISCIFVIRTYECFGGHFCPCLHFDPLGQNKSGIGFDTQTIFNKRKIARFG